MISALRAAIEKIPTREERLGGQTFKYVKLSEVLDLLDTFRSSNADETTTRQCPYCGQLAPVNQIEQPVDYCHHDVLPAVEPAGALPPAALVISAADDPSHL